MGGARRFAQNFLQPDPPQTVPDIDPSSFFQARVKDHLVLKIWWYPLRVGIREDFWKKWFDPPGRPSTLT